jgi:hypothetical protein
MMGRYLIWALKPNKGAGLAFPTFVKNQALGKQIRERTDTVSIIKTGIDTGTCRFESRDDNQASDGAADRQRRVSNSCVDCFPDRQDHSVIRNKGR